MVYNEVAAILATLSTGSFASAALKLISMCKDGRQGRNYWSQVTWMKLGMVMLHFAIRYRECNWGCMKHTGGVEGPEPCSA